MAIPDKLTISSSDIGDIGHYDGGKGQFLGMVAATLPDPSPADWEQHKRWWAILHRFDSDGNHLGTETRLAGIHAEGRDAVIQRGEDTLAEMIAALGPVERGPIEIRLFSVEVEGFVFGLVDTTFERELEEGEEEGEEEGDEDDSDAEQLGLFPRMFLQEQLTLYPAEVVFYEPWDGEEYDT